MIIPLFTGLSSPERQCHSQVVNAPSRWMRRWTIVALCFFAFMLCNMDRVNMSIAVLPMSKQFGWDSGTIGVVQSSFFWYSISLQSTLEEFASALISIGSRIIARLS